MTPADLYRTCRVSAFRLEALQDYAVAGDDDRRRRQAFFAGDPLPPPGPGKQDDLRLIERRREDGIRVGRIHLVDRPLTDYLRYELAVYPENIAAGEDVRIVDRSLHPELDAVIGDFAVFDGETGRGTVVWFDYGKDGRLLGYRITDAPDAVEHGRSVYAKALRRSVPLSEFMAASANTPTR